MICSNLKKMVTGLIIITSVFFNNYLVLAADANSILALLKAPIAGFSLPSNLIAQANSYLLSHPDINYELLEAAVINARGIVQEAISGKEINSMSDIAKYVDADKRRAIIASLKNAMNNANMVVAVGQNEDGKENVAVIDKETGATIFAKESIIKATGRESKLSLKMVKYTMFMVLFFIESFFILKFKKIKSNSN